MSLIDKKSTYAYKPQVAKTSKESKLHFTYSINGKPVGIKGSKPKPSKLDLNGEIPIWALGKV